MNVSVAHFGRMAAGHWVEADQSALVELEEANIETIEADRAFEEELKKATSAVTEQWIVKANEAFGTDLRSTGLLAC